MPMECENSQASWITNYVTTKHNKIKDVVDLEIKPQNYVWNKILLMVLLVSNYFYSSWLKNIFYLECVYTHAHRPSYVWRWGTVCVATSLLCLYVGPRVKSGLPSPCGCAFPQHLTGWRSQGFELGERMPCFLVFCCWRWKTWLLTWLWLTLLSSIE